jgi:hypothetical protein
MTDRDVPLEGLLIDGRRELGPSALEHYSEQNSVFIAAE